jgi:hypothetical protein
MILGNCLPSFLIELWVKKTTINAEMPVFSNDQIVTHIIPVREQMHWIKFVFVIGYRKENKNDSY